MARALWSVIVGTFTLRFSTGLTGALLVYYLDHLPAEGGPRVDALVVSAYAATFFATELLLSTPFGMLSDRRGHHRIMQVGPAFGAVAVVLTYLTTNLVLLGGTRILEGASTAASVPSILGYIAVLSSRDELLRGRAASRFEGATLAGLGVGLVAAGPLWHAFGREAFLLNAGIYGLSFLIYRFVVPDIREDVPTPPADHGWRRYLGLLTSSHVLLLAPTWIAINAALGLWTTQSIFQLVHEPKPGFEGQFLMGRFSPLQISLGLAIALLVFFAGLAFWGDRFRRFRRTTIIGYGIAGGAALVVAGLLVNHAGSLPLAVPIGFGIVAASGLFVLAGATPAALGLLADISEAYPADRGAIMGLYSVFLAIGQITGSLLGGVAADLRGLDGMFVTTLALLGVALLPLARLRAFEHVVDEAGQAQLA